MIIDFAVGNIDSHAYHHAAVMKHEIEKKTTLKIRLVPGLASSLSLKYVSDGLADIGKVHNFEMELARRGKYPFTRRYTNIRAVANTGGQEIGGVFQFGIVKSLGLNSFEEIQESKHLLKLYVPVPVTSSYIITNLVFEEYGLHMSDIVNSGGFVEYDAAGYGHKLGVIGIKKNKTNAICGSDYLPSKWIEEVMKLGKMKLIPIRPDIVEKLHKFGLLRKVITKKDYLFLREEVETISDVPMICARKDLSDDAVYDITKGLCESSEALKKIDESRSFVPENAWGNVGKLHDGSIRYYEEKGYLS